MKIAPRCALAATFAAVACMDSPNAPSTTLRTPDAMRSSITTTPNDACTVHWASGVAGSWFDASKWSPVGVPSSSSSVCIDAAGTYLVSLDPATDATPVDVLALTIGGTGATPTLRLLGVSTTLNAAQGIDIKQNGAFDLQNTTGATVNVTRAITNAGTFSITAPCGGCGSGNVVNSDIVNSGTWSATGFVSLAKVGGAYQNTGAISVTQVAGITVPVTASTATFTQDAGTITPTQNSGTILMRSGTFQMNGGKVRGRSLLNGRPSVVVDGGTIVIAATATDSASLGAVANETTQTTVTGDIPAFTALWVGGAVSGQAASITLTGNPTNAGALVVAAVIDGATGGTLTITGPGRLTNTGTIDQSHNSGSQAFFHYTLDVTNNGSWLQTTAFGTVLEKVGGMYVNNGTIDMGPTSSVFITRVVGATLTNLGTVTGGTLTADANSHVVIAGTQNTNLTSVNGGIVDPGNPLGVAPVYLFRPTATGVLRIELGGTTLGTGYDRLDATTSTTLGGTLQIVEANNFQSGQCGQVFDVVTHTLASGYGTFSTVTGLNPAPGRSLRLLYINATPTTKGFVRLVGFDGAQKVCVGSNPVSISEGGAGVQYAIALDHAPTASVTVTATPDAQVTVSPPSLVFTTSNWQMPQFFTVTAVDDQAQEGAHTGTVTHAVTSTDNTYVGAVTAALTANITDNDVNSPPVAVNDGATTAEDTPVTLSVLTNDSDPEGQPLIVTAVSSPAHGSAQVTGGGTTVTYTPNANYNGADSFTYTVSDGGRTNTATVSINVTAVNDLPIARNDQATGRSQALIAVDVLANDADPDGGALTVTQVSVPAHGTAAIVSGGGSVTYQSAAGWIGPDQFTYTITDASGATATATVSLTVLDPTSNRPPVAVNDVAQITKSNSTVKVSVLDNDFDPDGDAFHILDVFGATNGTVRMVGQSIEYTITVPSAGQGSFSYQIRDALGATATGTVSVTWASPTREIDLFFLGAKPKMAGAALEPNGWFGVTGLEWSTSAPFNSSSIVEVDLPPQLVGMGVPLKGPSAKNGSVYSLQPQDNCTLTYNGNTPVKYTCVFPVNAKKMNLSEGFSFIAARGTVLTFTARLTLTTPGAVDPNPSNNILTFTLQVP